VSGIFASLFEHRSSKPEKRGWEDVAIEAWRMNASAAGANVTPESAMRMAAVFSAIRILGEDVGSLPLFIYEKLERGRRKAPEMYLSSLFDQPNPNMTSMEYREVIEAHLAAWGNGYSRIESDGSGRPKALWPLHPGSLIQTEKRNGIKYYQFRSGDGKNPWYSQFEIWHLHGLGDDGERGYSPIQLMRRAVGLGLSAEEFGAKFFENDARPGIVLEHPARLSDPAYKNLKESWNEELQGSAKSHQMRILEEGMKLHEVGIPPEDAQFIETRKYQVTEIARMFRLPPHMLADLEHATFSNIEHQSIDYVRGSLRPWLVRWEQSIGKNLMLPEERVRYYARHSVDGLLRGDIQSRYAAYNQGRNGGWLSANDIRELEDMEPIEGGDIYLVPLNMVPADQAGANNASAPN
jgi:HK97 family phage portal protein